MCARARVTLISAQSLERGRPQLQHCAVTRDSSFLFDKHPEKLEQSSVFTQSRHKPPVTASCWYRPRLLLRLTCWVWHCTPLPSPLASDQNANRLGCCWTCLLLPGQILTVSHLPTSPPGSKSTCETYCAWERGRREEYVDPTIMEFPVQPFLETAQVMPIVANIGLPPQASYFRIYLFKVL